MFVILTLGEALPIGLALAIAIMFGGKISGGHFNPAVSLAMFMGKRMKERDLMMYVISQVLGAISALYVVRYVN